MAAVNIGDVIVVDGNYVFDGDNPCLILDAATALRARAEGELVELVDTALRALDLSDKAVVYVKQQEEA